jgi:two-component system chemotaxis sensor kinase CheA
MDWGVVSDKEDVDDLTKEFITESQEGLDRMERCLTTLEAHPKDGELVGEIFRAVHTIKGTTGFLGFHRLELLAHAGESLLVGLRDGRLEVTTELITGLLDLLDGLRRIVALIEATGGEGERAGDQDLALIEMLHALSGREPTMKPAAETVKESAPKVTAEVALARVETTEGLSAAPESGASEKTLRIDVEILNRMMNLVGELVLTRNQILQSSLDAQGFAQLGSRLDSVTADLRETVMQARMQPVGHVFSKFPRMVRDLARTCGRMVRLEFSGQETGLDKSLLEAIKDPLTHAVRNAVDHGIEPPVERMKVGKAAEGVVRLRAFHQGGSVVIEVSDDGGGIPIERVRAKALERGLVTVERAQAMSERDVLQMVFLPGFSTAEALTHVSGRGVGMDVVRSNIERVGGSVELESDAGRGTTLRLRVPLTLAIIPALVVLSGGQSFALPQSALIELVYVPRREADEAIERIGGTELYRLRERLLPLVRLDRLLGIESQIAIDNHGFYVAVLEAEGCKKFGLVLDDLLAPEEIVVKPLSLVLREIGVFSGATVLGNGSLALILDLPATAARAGIGLGIEGLVAERPREVREDGSAQRFLIFESRVGPGQAPERSAIPLGDVERIESVGVEAIEYASGQPMLQYRGETLALEDEGGVLDHLRVQGVVRTGWTVTVLICQKPWGGGQKTRRLGMVVQQVFHVASGTLLAPSEEDDGGASQRRHLALVDGHVTTVHAAFAPGLLWPRSLASEPVVRGAL